MKVTNLTKSFGERVIFSNVSFQVSDGEKLGIVGANGAGKSTLLKVLLGLEESDSGEISGLRAEDIGYAEQLPNFTAETLLAEIGGAEFQAKKILYGLGFSETDLNKNPNEFSGGESAKISLAKALIAEPRILILDEPTNHLDIYAIDFFTQFIKTYKGAVILVTHDRYLLQYVDKILELPRGEIYSGNYAKYIEQRDLKLAAQLKAYEKQQAEIAKLEDFVRRNKTRASTARRARSRQKALDKIERIEKPESAQVVKMQFQASESAERVLTIENLNFKNIIINFQLSILNSEKVGLIGRNGAGKSTLLKLIVGDLKADSGEIKIGNRVKIGYLSQVHSLNAELTPIGELAEEFRLDTEQARAQLARLNIGAELAEKQIGTMSGGEKTRVALAKLILRGANFLLLDEPTNHLDIAAREAIEQALRDFSGTVLIVTHDRYLLDAVTSRTVELTIENEELTISKPPKVQKPKPQKNYSSTNTSKTTNLEKLDAQIKMAEMELKMLETEINSTAEPERLAELAKLHAEKLAEIDSLYLQLEIG